MLDLIEGKATAPAAIDSAAKFRASLYDRTAKFCARMRSTLDNCAIPRVSISADANQANASVEVSMSEPLRQSVERLLCYSEAFGRTPACVFAES
jgi:hypothetical protein